MRLRPSVLRLLAAFVLAFGLLGAFTAPSLAQDEGTPTPVEPTPETEAESQVEAADVTGTLLLLYYLCDGGAGFEFTVGNPGDGNPNPLVDDCAPASASDGTDATFLIYPFGDLNSAPIEITTVDGFVTQELPPTDQTAHKISQKLPDDSEETPVQEDFFILADTFTGVNATQFQVGTVELHKYLCEGDPSESFMNALNPGEQFDPSPYESCSTSEAAFTITPFDDSENFDPIPAQTESGLATVPNVPTTTLISGPHKISEDGTELVRTFDVSAGQTTVVVAVNYLAPGGTLTINKLNCVGEGETEFTIDADPEQADDPNCDEADASFSIYLFGDTESTPITDSTGGDGTVDVLGLPVTADASPHLLVEDETSAETSFDIVADTTTVVNVVNFTPPPAEDGTVEIEKLACTGLADPVMEIGDPGDDAPGIPDNCSNDAADFVIYPFGDEQGDPIVLTVDGFDSVELPPSDGDPHLLMELDDAGEPVANGFFHVASGEFTPIQVQNPTYGNLTIFSYLCDDEQDSWFEVYEPGQSYQLPTNCEALDRNFDITVFGTDPDESNDSVTVSTGSDGIVSLSGLPATDGVDHLIEKGNVNTVQAEFEVDPDELTVIISYVTEPDDDDVDNGGVIDDDDDDYDDTDDSENVDDVPDTGSGPAEEAPMAMLFGTFSLMVLAGFALIARRRSA